MRIRAALRVSIACGLAVGSGVAQAGTLNGFVGKLPLPATPLPGVAVLLFDAQRTFVRQVVTAADGTFSFTGISGNYFLLTRKDDDDRVDLAWPDEPCPMGTCGNFPDANSVAVPALGTVTLTPSFILPLGVTFSGTVTAVVGGAGLQAQVFGMPSSHNFQVNGPTDASGHFSLPGYPKTSGGNPITYKIQVNPSGASQHYIGEAWNNVPCPHFSCDLNAVGTAIDVQAGDPVLDFALDDGSTISGHAYDGPGTATLASSPGLAVWVYDLVGGVEGSSAVEGGTYSVSGLAAGGYRAVLVGDDHSEFFASQIFDGVPCFGSSCIPPTGGTTIAVGTAATSTVDFHLATGMRIEGRTVNGATGADALFEPHVFAGSSTTDLGHLPPTPGHYALTLPPGPPVRIGMLAGGEFVDQMWNGHPCAGSCPGAAGDLITIVPGTDFIADFALDPGPLDFFPSAPCRALDTRTLSDPLPSGTTRAYALGAVACGIPFQAVSIAVNITIVSPSGSGNLALWASEGPTPATSVSSFKAGITRANNAVVSVGHDMSIGVNARLTMSPPGSADLVIDVTGYFIRPGPVD